MITIGSIKTDYLERPLGVTGQPQFSWVIEGDSVHVIQKNYQLQISTVSDFSHLCFDSKTVLSNQSAQVKAESFVLETACRYFCRVRVVSTDGEETGWSSPAEFISGIQTEAEWKAKFITGETEEEAGKSSATYLRKILPLRKKVKEAIAYTSALGLYEFSINGIKIGTEEMAPGWTSYNKHLLYQTNDITQQIKKGYNVLVAEVGAGWYKGKMGFVGNRNNYGDKTAFLAQLYVTYEDDSKDIFVTDENWFYCKSPVVFAEIYDGEIYDSSLEQEDFFTPEYYDYDMEEVMLVEHPYSTLTAQEGCRVKKMDTMPAVSIFTTPTGDTVVDFGQNMTGWVETTFRSVPGESLVLHCFEVLDSEGNVYLDNLRSAKQEIIYLCSREDRVTYCPKFTFYGFRYVKVDSFPGGTPKAEDFTAYTLHSEMEQTGTFECSNQDINQLQHNITWGLKGNFLDVPTDCPQRNERLGWTGDAQIFCRTASYLMNTYQFFAKWLKDVAADQAEDGGVAHVVPDIVTGSSDSDWLVGQGTMSAAAWADVAVINPWTMYLTYGDTKILEDQYESMKGWIDFMTAHAVDGIWTYKLQFGDWVALDAEEGSYFGATPTDLTCVAYYAYSSGLFAKIAKVLGKEEDAKEYLQLHESVVKAFHRHYFNADGSMTASTQTAHIIALYFKLVPDEYIDKTAAALVKLLEKENGHLVTGFIGTPYFCHALSQNGYIKEAYELLLKDDFPSWLYQVKMGATTVWEHWDGIKPDGTMWSPDMNSFNHYAYGAIGEWLYRVVAGIEIDEEAPGYKHSIICPRIGGNLSYVTGTYQSVYGKVSSSWTKEGDKVTLRVKVPHNTTAEIRLMDAKEILENGGLVFEEKDGIKSAETGSKEAVIVYTV